MISLTRVLALPWLKNFREAADTVQAATLFGAPALDLLLLVYVTWLRDKVGASVALTAGAGIVTTASESIFSVGAARERGAAGTLEYLTVETRLTVEATSGHSRYTYRKEMQIRALAEGLGIPRGRMGLAFNEDEGSEKRS